MKITKTIKCVVTSCIVVVTAFMAPVQAKDQPNIDDILLQIFLGNWDDFDPAVPKPTSQLDLLLAGMYIGGDGILEAGCTDKITGKRIQFKDYPAIVKASRECYAKGKQLFYEMIQKMIESEGRNEETIMKEFMDKTMKLSEEFIKVVEQHVNIDPGVRKAYLAPPLD